jgi:5-hydroxyisourate hydrolase
MSVSTHVLDTARGVPAAGVAVRLEQRHGTEWLPVRDAITDPDGRVGELAGELAPGVYRMTFDVAGYAGAQSFFPEVAISFQVLDGAAHHHVPLLLSPYAYSTYRGS